MGYGNRLKKDRKKSVQTSLILVGIFVVIALVFYFTYQNIIKPRLVKDPPGATSQPTNSEQPEAQIKDNNPSTSPSATTPPVSSIPKQEQQVDSSIIIDLPTENATVTGGSKLEGSAPKGIFKVLYRLQSDDRGLIGRGELNVADGRFSGSLVATGVSGNGYIEVFILDANGREQKHAKVVVKYQ